MTALLEWIPTQGAPIDLDSFVTGYLLTDYPAGLTMPPPVITASATFDRPGQAVQNVQLDIRPVTIPLAVLGTTEPDVSTKTAFLARAMNPIFGAGQLRVTRDDGIQRVLPCLYTGGLEGEFMVDEMPGGDLWYQTTVALSAYDPYWTDDADTTLSFGTTGAATWFGHPWFPLVLGGGTVFADTTITNAGDDLAWPAWTLLGPMTNPTLTNTTTGKVIDLSGGVSLATGDTLVIDTRPGAGTILKTASGTTTNQWPAMTNASDLWPFVRGDNVVSIVAGGADDSSRVDIAYRLRWLSY